MSKTKRGKAAFQTFATLAMPLLAAVVAGCSGSQFDFAPVSGRVTLDGQPVPNARVVFMPQATGDSLEAGPYSNGTTDAEGRYELAAATDAETPGAVVGPHRVIVSTRKSHLDPDNLDVEIIDQEEIIPLPYWDYRESPLRFDLPSEGTEEANFDLTSDKKRRR